MEIPRPRSRPAVGDRDRPPLDAVGREDLHLGLVDYRRADEGAERARVCDREGPARDPRRPRSLIGEIGHGSARPRQGSWRDGTGTINPLTRGRARDAEVDVTMNYSVSSPTGGVGLPAVGSRGRSRPRPGRTKQVGETDPLLFAEPVLVRFAPPLHPLVVGFDHDEGVSRGRLRPDHAVGGGGGCS